MNASEGKLIGEATGEVETEEKVLVLKRIHVHYRLEASAEHLETIERVHGFHARYCPVYRSIEAAIDVTTDFELVESS